MAISTQALLNGISGLLVLLIGFFYGFYFLILYTKKKRKLQPIVAALGFCAGLIFLGVSANFLSLVFTGNNLTKNQYGLLSYTIIPVSTVIALFLGFHIFKPKWKKQITVFYSILWVIYWIAIYGFTDSMFESNNPGPGELLDISLMSVIRYLTIFYVFSLLFVLSGGFLSLRIKMKKSDPNAKEIKYLTFLSLGWFLFGVSSIIDSIAPAEYISFIVAARIMMCCAYILIFEGFKGAD